MARWRELAQQFSAPAARDILVEPVADETRFEEVAAVNEYDGRHVRPWAEELARLQLAPRPQGFSPARWQQVIADAFAFSERWGETALALGWDLLSVFGCSRHPNERHGRYDQDGLVILLRGRSVLAITENTATISEEHGHMLTFRRVVQPGGTLLWHINSEGHP